MHLKGDLDASNFLEVVTKAQEIYQKPASNLIIDLSEVPYISSAGLVAIHKIALLYSGVPQQGRGKHSPRFYPQQQCAQTCQTSQPTARCRSNT